MSKYPEFLTAFLTAALIAGTAAAGPFGLGRPALPEEVAAWDLDISPDGTGLPDGSGNALDGEGIFSEKCAACHGEFAEGIDNWPELAGGQGTLNRADPVKTVGSYWPHLSTAFDYVRRSMPFGDAGNLTDDEVYAIVAYILYSNDLIEDDFELSRETFLEVAMPNADGFFVDDRAELEYPQWSVEPCMTDCKDTVEVTMRARVLDVTPGQNHTDAVAPETETAEAEPSFDAALAAEGEKVFRKCASCHQVGAGAKNRAGPILTGIVGSPAGQVEGFKYSNAMSDAAANGLVWSEAELSAFLAAPKKYLKGTKMSFAGLKKDEDLAAVVEYLKSTGN